MQSLIISSLPVHNISTNIRILSSFNIVGTAVASVISIPSSPWGKIKFLSASEKQKIVKLLSLSLSVSLPSSPSHS